MLLCESINITLDLSCHQTAPLINYLNVVGTKKKSKDEWARKPQQGRWGYQTRSQKEKERGKCERMLERRRGFLTASYCFKVTDMDRTWGRLLRLCRRSVGPSGGCVVIFLSCWFREALVIHQDGWRGRRVQFVCCQRETEETTLQCLIQSTDLLNMFHHLRTRVC